MALESRRRESSVTGRPVRLDQVKPTPVVLLVVLLVSAASHTTALSDCAIQAESDI